MIIVYALVGIIGLMVLVALVPNLGKLFTIGKNKVDEKLDSVVANHLDIKREGNAMIKQLEKKAETLKSKVEQAMASINLNKAKVDQMKREVQTFDEAAERFVEKGDDDKARQMLLKSDMLGKTIVSLQKSIDELIPVIEDRKLYLHQLKADRDALSHELVRMDLEYETAKTKAEMMNTEGGVNVTFNINDLRTRLETAKATVEAKESIAKEFNDTNVEKSMESSLAAISVEDRLQALKNKSTK